MKRILMATLAAVAALTAGSVRADEPAVAAVVRGNNAFALDLYAKLRAEDGNLFFSPYSISTALAMTYAGARGDTADEMDKTLHFTLPQERLHPAFAALIKAVNGDADKKRGYQLSTANALWGQKGYPFRPDFLKLTQDDYGAGLNEVDFADADRAGRARRSTPGSRSRRNDKIKDLLPPGDLTDDTRLVLTNAIYFKGDWASQFKKDHTKDAPFLLAPTRRSTPR